MAYTEAQKRATYNWNKKNWDRVLLNRRNQYARAKVFFDLCKLTRLFV